VPSHPPIYPRQLNYWINGVMPNYLERRWTTKLL
jgi:hypothetical protein